ncbi:AraC family transcriptional regulator [Pseudomonas sp. zfem002]|uniref:AraC family transcriptional regulator n=1 Tax=Pseudomonas sp. zfem002 TaxID=3078197 RepID=UPI002929034B|nr:AraC family transcriptional regulator [Pseudomonas sp. zfem002]MDU9393938.1 AraC family transcriptional regulator [Pseudomonas sp. zfem002]
MSSFVLGIALLGFREFASSQGLDPEQLLKAVGAADDQPNAPLSGECFAALLERAAEQSGNPLFGLQFGLHQGSSALGALLHVVRSAQTVGEALDALIRYFPTHSNGAALRLEQHGQQAWLMYDMTDGTVPAARQTVELAMAIGGRIMEALLGRAWLPHEMLLRHPAGARPPGYRALLEVLPRFDSPVNAWVFDHALLKNRISAADNGLQHLLKRHFEDLSNLDLQTLPGYVERLIRNGLFAGNISIEHIAAQLMFSPRTLQRYLHTQGTSFQTLLDNTREAMAKRYLCDSSINLTQLSVLLGYTCPGTFSRAFARWCGVAPQKWRKHYRRAQRLALTDACEDAP